MMAYSEITKGELGDGGLRIEFVQNLRDYVQAFRLMQEECLLAGSEQDRKAGLRFSLLQLMPGSRTLIARQDGMLVGTISMCFLNEGNLPEEQPRVPEFRELAGAGRRVGEVQMFAMLPRWGGSRVEVAESLFFAALITLIDDGFDDAIFWLQNSHIRFFARSLGSDPLAYNDSSPETEPRLTPFNLNLHDLFQHGAHTFPMLVTKGAFCRTEQHRLSDEEVAILLIKAAQLQGRLSPEEASVLIGSYPGISSLLRELNGTSPHISSNFVARGASHTR